jgi:serine phosphatase RsbU (regulator of sigma subunit)/putative methionine-R-sulfoxide reductase with GAF domain
MAGQMRDTEVAHEPTREALAGELAEAIEKQAATSDVLRMISSHPTDAQPIFDMIAQRAKQVCEGQFCAVFRFDGEFIHLVANHGMSPEGALVYHQHFPVRPGRINAIGRAIQDRSVTEIPDIEADAEYGSGAVAKAVTFRSIVGVPMMRDGKAIGGIAVSRAAVGRFPAKHIDQLRTFADQAVIAVDNVRMFNESEDALKRQTATSDVLRVISSSPTDTEPVFDTIVRNAVVLCDALFGIVFRVEGDLIRMVAHHNLTPQVLELLGRLYPMRPSAEHASGRVILSGALVHVHDVLADPNYHRGVAAFGGWRSLLAVPMMSREGAAVGVIWIARAAAGPFPDNQIALLQTFAEQAVIAIENVRMFRQLEARTEALTQSADQLAAANAQVTALNTQLKTENLRMGIELDVTRRLQLMLLPGVDELRQVEGLDIAGHMQPAVEVGGDYFDVLQHGGRVKIGIGDVTGHGLESGVLMVMTQAIVRALLASGEIDHVRFLTILNHALFGNVQRMGGDKNLTLCLLDYAAGEMKVSGQHEEMIVVRRDGTVERVDTIDLGFPVGLVEEISQFIGQVTVKLLPGDGVVLYTDGITEAENMADEQYGLARLCAVVSRHWSQSAEAIKDAVVSDVARYIGAQTVYDDITLVVVKQQ